MILRLRHSRSSIITLAGLAGGAAALIVLFSARVQFGWMLLAVSDCTLGFIRPRLAWASALSTAGGFAFASLIVPLAGVVTPFTPRQGVLIGLIGLALAFAGAYLGALAGRILAAPPRRRER